MSRTTVVGAAATRALATITSGTALSPAADLDNARLAKIVMPAAWTAASLTFQTSDDGVTYSNLYTAAGVEYTVTAAASTAIVVPIVDWIGTRFVKVRSGTSGSPVNQGADRVITLVVVP